MNASRDSAPAARGRVGVSVILIAAMLVGAVAIVLTMVRLKPKPPHAPPEINLVAVEALTVSLIDHPVQVLTQGAFQPLTETKLASEVSGRIVSVAPNFQAGGQFAEGGILLEIDPSNYIAAAADAESALADARLAIVSEQARADQARRDWERLAPKEKPGDLVLRVPQLASVRAKLIAAEAALEKARHDLDRTKVQAPYPCSVKTKKSDLGDYVVPGTALAEVWRSDVIEVRLPVGLDQLALVDIDAQPPVVLSAAGQEWAGKVVRSEGVVDTSMRSVFLVARLDTSAVPATPGLFAKGRIAGRTLKNVASVPRKAFLDGERLVVIDPQNTLRFRTVKAAWSEAERVFVAEGLQPGDRVCVTAVAAVVEGMPVRVLPDQSGIAPGTAVPVARGAANE